jgi:hypothetical protein
MLPEFADMGAAETPLSARFAPGLRSRSHDRAYDHRKPSGGPPRVDRAVMLPEFADMGAAETPLSARFAHGLRDQLGEMGFDADCNCRTGSLEVVKPFHFIGNELEIGRVLQGQEALESTQYQ